VRGGRRGHDRQGPVPAGHAEGICTFGYRCLNERCQALARGQDDSFDASLARSLNDPVALGRTPAGPGIDEQHRLPRAAGGVPATTQQLLLDPLVR